MKDPSAQRFLYYGVDFADHVWDGPPEAPVTAAMSPSAYAVVDPNNPNTILEFENFTGTHTIAGQPATNAGNPVARRSATTLIWIPCSGAIVTRRGDLIPASMRSLTSTSTLVHASVSGRIQRRSQRGRHAVHGQPARAKSGRRCLLRRPPLHPGIGFGLLLLIGGFGGLGGRRSRSGPIGFTDYPKSADEPAGSGHTAAMLLRTYVRPWADLHVATDY